MKLPAKGGQAKPVAVNATGETRSSLLVVQLYGLYTLFIVARSFAFQRLRLKEDFDIIVELEGLAS